jgi:hypothetical protein
MVPVCGASLGDLDLAAEIFPLWKSNKKVLQCQRISALRARSDGDRRITGVSTRNTVAVKSGAM